MRLSNSVKQVTVPDILANRDGARTTLKRVNRRGWRGLWFSSMQEPHGNVLATVKPGVTVGLRAPKEWSQLWPRRRLRSVASGTLRGACHSRSSHPGKSRSNLPGSSLQTVQIKQGGCQLTPWPARDANTAMSPPLIWPPHCGVNRNRSVRNSSPQLSAPRKRYTAASVLGSLLSTCFQARDRLPALRMAGGFLLPPPPPPPSFLGPTSKTKIIVTEEVKNHRGGRERQSLSVQ